MADTFDLEGARKAGATDDAILEHLRKSRDFDVEGALKAGASKGDIIQHMAGMDPTLQMSPLDAALRPVDPHANDVQSGRNIAQAWQNKAPGWDGTAKAISETGREGLKASLPLTLPASILGMAPELAAGSKLKDLLSLGGILPGAGRVAAGAATGAGVGGLVNGIGSLIPGASGTAQLAGDLAGGWAGGKVAGSEGLGNLNKLDPKSPLVKLLLPYRMKMALEVAQDALKGKVPEEPTPGGYQTNPNLQRLLNMKASGDIGAGGTSGQAFVAPNVTASPDAPVAPGGYIKNPNIQSLLNLKASGNVGSAPLSSSVASPEVAPSQRWAPTEDPLFEGFKKNPNIQQRLNMKSSGPIGSASSNSPLAGGPKVKPSTRWEVAPEEATTLSPQELKVIVSNLKAQSLTPQHLDTLTPKQLNSLGITQSDLNSIRKAWH